MEDKELSQWFDINEQKPWEPGVYEVQRQDYDYSGQLSLFKNGKFNEVAVDGPDSAIYWAEISGIGDGCDVIKWRGLASDPSAKPKPKVNRKVTRYVIMDPSYSLPTPVATYACKENAQERKQSIPGGYILKIRFRTPEA